MSTVTPNFNWPVPTSTDLVKDGATAIEALGDAIDTSMVDLKGGTTGQILSKASGTDMDFSWVAQDDSNAIQNSIVDAKGDLISATANDTPARLAVGSNYAFLQADSAQSTGLVWNNAAWTSYTPTVGVASGSLTSATITGRYLRIGKLCILQNRLTITTNGTAGTGTYWSIPFTSQSVLTTMNMGVGRENAVTGNAATLRIPNGDTNAYMCKYDGGYLGGNGYTIDTTICYEVA